MQQMMRVTVGEIDTEPERDNFESGQESETSCTHAGRHRDSHRLPAALQRGVDSGRNTPTARMPPSLR